MYAYTCTVKRITSYSFIFLQEYGPKAKLVPSEVDALIRNSTYLGYGTYAYGGWGMYKKHEFMV